MAVCKFDVHVTSLAKAKQKRRTQTTDLYE